MPDSIKFTELPSGTLSANSIFATAEEAGGGSFASTKVNAANVGNYLVGALQYAGINTEDKTVEGALNELLTYASNIAEEYDSTATYDVDDFVIYSGVLYKCIVAISTPEAWTPAHWTSTLVVDNFGSGGASVTLGTTVPSDATGSNGDLYVQYDSVTYAVIEYFVKINGSWRKSPYSRVVALTQAEYDLITPDTSTLYIITDAQSSYQTKQDANLQTTADTIVGAINELKSDSEYHVGDTITASIYKHCAGRTTNAGDKVLFFYPTAKPISGNCSSASLVVVSGNGQCFTSTGAKALKAGTYTGTITDGGLYFLVDLDTAYTDGGRVATVELQSRTITFS